MADELVFYTNPMSRGRIIRWMLEEVGQPYRTEVLDYGTSMKSPEYLAVNPMGKVPAIKHGDVVVTEAAAICAYLADAFPKANLAPPVTSKARGAYYRWLFFGAGCIEPAVTSKALALEAPPEKKGMVGFGSMEDVVSALDAVLTKQDYLAGDAFSAADLYICSQLGFGLRFGTIEKRPSFESYTARLYARPAAIRANEIDDALIAKQQAG
ncbi:MAG: glutathione S-transferase family protein [Hyphomonadaceae bacterium]|nr:glutathione S-transferase family protein [Hyphomonadaceae bacterium]